MSLYDEFPSQKKLFGMGVAWLVGITVVVLALSAAIWGGSVLLSDTKGAGDAIKQNNSVVNRVQKQEQFEQLVTDYDGYLVKIEIAKQAVANAEGIDKELRETELVGLKQTCVDAAQQFNAESRKYTSRKWKSAGLPPNLDPQGCV